MKILHDGSTAFYESKIKKIIPAAIIFFIFALIFLSILLDPQGGDPLVLILMTLFSIGMIIDLIASFFCGPRVIINNKYIKMKGFPEILLEHIASATVDKRYSLGSRRRKWTLTVNVAEPSLYHLTVWQKTKIKLGVSPFSITVHYLSKKDRTDLESIVNSLNNQKAN